MYPFLLVFHSSWYCLLRTEWLVVFLLNGQNLFSMTKVISWQSLNKFEVIAYISNWTFFSMFTILPMFFEYVPIKFVDVSSKPTLCILLNLIYMGLLTGKCSWQCLPPPAKIQQWNTKKRCWILSKLTMKTPEECQCFLMSPCQWGPSGRYRCVWICFNIKLSFHNLFHLVHGKVHSEANKCTSYCPTVTQSTMDNVFLNLLLGAQTFI